MAKAVAKKRGTAAKKSAVKKTAKKAVGKKAAVKKSVVKKTTKKKAASKKTGEERYKFKYSDKSKGQPKELQEIWQAIRDMMLPYEKGVMKVHGGSGGQITLINHKPAEIFGRKRDEVWFAAALIQKGYVGFYLMPIYGAKNDMPVKPELMKCLKGQACFHIKKADPILYGQIKEALKLGFDAYRKKGWI